MAAAGGKVEEVDGEGDGALALLEDKVKVPSPPPSSSSPEDNHRENQDNPFLKLFKVDVIADCLMYFVEPLKDMKALMECSKDALEIVQKCKWFMSRVRLNIPYPYEAEESEEEEEDTDTGLPGLLGLPWRHLGIDAGGLQPEILEKVENIDKLLGSATSLYLYEGDFVCNEVEAPEYLERILKKTRNMRTLKVEEGLLSKLDGKWFQIEAVQEALGRLQYLEICYFHEDVNVPDFLDEVELGRFWDSFTKFSLAPSQLRGMTMRDTKTQFWTDFKPEYLGFIHKNKNTLEKVELGMHVGDDFWTELKKVGVPCCPNLKRLNLFQTSYGRVHKISEVPVIFLEHQPPLEELEISTSNNSIIRSFKQEMGCRMRKFHILMNPSDEEMDASIPFGPVDWSFLGGMHLLKDICITISRDMVPVPYGEEILKTLPSQIEKIKLSGFGKFFRRNYSRKRSNPNYNIGSLLAPFKKLKEIDFSDNCGAVTDEGLQTIISNFPNLRSLHFSDEDGGLTDYGVTGVRRTRPGPWSRHRKTGVSLDDLKDLTDLKISSCPNVSILRIFSVVKYPFLRYFEYSANFGVRLEEDLILLLCRNNPSLEKVELSCGNADEFENESFDRIWEANPRMSSIDIQELARVIPDDSDSDYDNPDPELGNEDDEAEV